MLTSSINQWCGSSSMDWLQVAMLLWSYFACVLTDPGKTPEGWHPFETDEVDRTFCLRIT